MSGPVPKPSRNVVTPRVATVLEQFKSCAMAGMAAVWIEEQKAMVAVMNTTMKVSNSISHLWNSPSDQLWCRSICARERSSKDSHRDLK